MLDRIARFLLRKSGKDFVLLISKGGGCDTTRNACYVNSLRMIVADVLSHIEGFPGKDTVNDLKVTFENIVKTYGEDDE